MKWEKCIISLVNILENPDFESGYSMLKKYYESNNMQYEAECIDYLIKEKFKNDNSTNNCK
jgi:hypothetical protein